jgi:hypothetical protein
VIGHAGRARPLKDYCTGLLLDCERKSVEPMAPTRTAAQHQSLLHFVGEGNRSDKAVILKVREMVLPSIERHGAIEAWIIDDTGFPKKGKHSVGVARQYCGQLGKQDNCQVAVSLLLANHEASLPVDYRLYLPKGWADDTARRDKAKVPEEITFKTKPEIALGTGRRERHAARRPRRRSAARYPQAREEARRLPLFRLHEPLRLIVVDGVDEQELGGRFPRQQDGAPHGPVGPRREIGCYQYPLHRLYLRISLPCAAPSLFGSDPGLERFLTDLNRRGFPEGRFSDSRCWLGLEASMDGSASFDGFALAASGRD